MTIAEKIEYATDKKIVTFFKEGLFYKCYNEDAMVFVQKIKEYKVSSKFIKSIGAEVLSLGFPVSEVQKGNISFNTISEAVKAVSYKEDTHRVVFSLKEDIKQHYNEFKEAIITFRESDTKKESINVDKNIHNLVKIIQEFDLANHTPMQAIVFIQELKNQIKTWG
jgi:hypothetical protein